MAAKTKKVPMRLCIACGQMRPKSSLIRLVKIDAEKIELDFTGKMSGRGAYICRAQECLQVARRGHKIEHAFRMRVSDETYEELEKRVEREFSGDAHDCPSCREVDTRT